MASSASRNHAVVAACLLLVLLSLTAVSTGSRLQKAEGESSPNLHRPCHRTRPETDPECLRVCGTDDIGRPPSPSNGELMAMQGSNDDDEVAKSCCCCRTPVCPAM